MMGGGLTFQINSLIIINQQLIYFHRKERFFKKILTPRIQKDKFYTFGLVVS